METLTELLEDQIKDLYNAENQLVKALPRMAKKASTKALSAAFEKHAQETQKHIDRIKQIAEHLGIKPTGKVCKAMKGLLEEAKEALSEKGHKLVIDSGMIAAAQRVEHYEISAYGTAKALAKQIGNNQVVKLLEQTEKEEVATDKKLTEVSEKFILNSAPKTDDDEGEEMEEDSEEEAKVKKQSKASASTEETTAESVSEGDEEESDEDEGETPKAA